MTQPRWTDEERVKWPYGEPPVSYGTVMTGVDFGSKDGDWSAEVEVKILPGGKMQINRVSRWRVEIDV